MPRAGPLLILLAAALWALLGPTVKALLARGVTPLEIALWRAVVAGALFAVQAAWIGQVRLSSRRDEGLVAAFALVGVSVFYAALPLAIERGGISLTTVLLYTAPAFVVLAARPLLGEAWTARKLGLTALAVTGVVVLVSDGGGRGITVTPASVSLGLLAGLSYSSYYLFGKWVLSRYPPATVFARALPLGALGLLPFVRPAADEPREWGLLLVAGVVSTYLPYLCYAEGLRRMEASRAVLVATLEPVMTVLLAMALFGERFGALGLVGAALVLAAAAGSALAPSAPRPAPDADVSQP